MGEEYHDDEDHEICNTRLGLGIGLDDFHVPKKISINQQKKKNSSIERGLDLSFRFHNFKYDDQEIVIDDDHHKGCKIEEGSSSKTINGEDQERQSNTSNDNNMMIMNNDDHQGGGVRKKLRLTKEQSTILEDSFKQHTTLNTAQKQALAEKLKLKPRQVEVWFQNRRARTKLKQTEVDCEFLKKCCENLSNENRRLKKELQELRSSIKNNNVEKAPFFVKFQKCPSCDQKMVRSKNSCNGDKSVKNEQIKLQM
ncbi:hypothetical protein M9H77_14466 [Catharanthus roseus]|uniref:Uncharacterized protein n=1 Tax=Catharanthus roseus TaxID=4058 RepID=A0ACC0BNC3_CATRO|nr:hypothetical protein M9H77_14466 [Catharanthus roseus]